MIGLLVMHLMMMISIGNGSIINYTLFYPSFPCYRQCSAQAGHW